MKPLRGVSSLLVGSMSLLALSGAAYLGTLTVRNWTKPSSADAAPLSAANSAYLTGQTVPRVVAHANPAVVEITDTAPAGPGTAATAQYLGSGFIVSKAGYIVTNDHVIYQAKNIQVKLVGHPLPVPAKVVGADFDLDLALLKVSVGNNLPTLPLGNYRSIKIGQFAVAIGNPEALNHSVTFGVISAEDRAIQAGSASGSQIRQYYNMLQTDAAINPGNSGGPLLNLAGQVVGVNTAVSTAGQSLGFAIPVSTLKRALPYLMKDQQAPDPWLGVEITDTTSGQAKKIHLSPVRGAYLAKVNKNSPAAKAGLKAGDVIIGFDGIPIYSSSGLLNAVQSKLPGDKVTIEVWNATGEHVLHAVLGQAPAHLVVSP